MKKQKNEINMDLAKTDPAAFMKELAQIDNHGEISVETLTEISAGTTIKGILDGTTTFGMMLPPKYPPFPDTVEF